VIVPPEIVRVVETVAGADALEAVVDAVAVAEADVRVGAAVVVAVDEVLAAGTVGRATEGRVPFAGD
jgi:hypothetical protein